MKFNKLFGRNVLSDILLFSTFSGVFSGLGLLILVSFANKDFYPENVLLLVVVFLILCLCIGGVICSVDQFKMFKSNAKRLSIKLILGTTLIISLVYPIIKITNAIIRTKNAYLILFLLIIILLCGIDIFYLYRSYLRFR